MPRPLNERQSLEQELAELPVQIAASLRELVEIPKASKDRAHRWLAWQVRNLEKRLAEVKARLAPFPLNKKARRGRLQLAAPPLRAKGGWCGPGPSTRPPPPESHSSDA